MTTVTIRDLRPVQFAIVPTARGVGNIAKGNYLPSAYANCGTHVPGQVVVAFGDITSDGGDRPRGSRPGDWTEAENQAIVDDYLAMLALESAGQPYSKTSHRNALIAAMG